MEGSRFAIMDFPEPGGPTIIEIVTAGSGYFQGTLHVLLALYICVVVVAMNLVLVKLLAGIYNGWGGG